MKSEGGKLSHAIVSPFHCRLPNFAIVLIYKKKLHFYEKSIPNNETNCQLICIFAFLKY